jgi:hypothetical protein
MLLLQLLVPLADQRQLLLYTRQAVAQVAQLCQGCVAQTLKTTNIAVVQGCSTLSATHMMIGNLGCR